MSVHLMYLVFVQAVLRSQLLPNVAEADVGPRPCCDVIDETLRDGIAIIGIRHDGGARRTRVTLEL